MKIINDFFENKIEEPTAITIGKFDGFHLGHEKLISLLKKTSLEKMVLTFDVSPRITLDSAEDKRNLLSFEERMSILENEDIDYCLICKFDDRFIKTEAEDFIRILKERYHMEYLCVGSDFRFGYKGLGDIYVLKELSLKYNFKLEVIEKIKDKNIEISSSLIRSEIIDGNVKMANELLGYPYFVRGKISHGKKIGSKIGIPTINLLPPSDKLLAKNGVYLTEVDILDKTYFGITNIGIRPTIEDDGHVSVETNLLNFNGDLYGEEATVRFLEFVRPEKTFNSLEELKRQIESDKAYAISYFGL
ncbi:MAG: bifunctional riboflavin kinase/FAD synthetase [Lachnospiraceae bacterium]|nr:bifunctional riboflavin kinase/FAD synthetase [Lachnospiraceae bacterium]